MTAAREWPDEIPRTPEGMRIVDGMVELPRNPVDERVDRLSHAAINTLRGWSLNHGTPITQGYSGITPWMKELLTEQLVEEVNGEIDDVGEQVSWFMNLTFDGWSAAERIKCGIYDEHKRIDASRSARDAMLLAQAKAMAALPLYGIF